MLSYEAFHMPFLRSRCPQRPALLPTCTRTSPRQTFLDSSSVAHEIASKMPRKRRFKMATDSQPLPTLAEWSHHQPHPRIGTRLSEEHAGSEGIPSPDKLIIRRSLRHGLTSLAILASCRCKGLSLWICLPGKAPAIDWQADVAAPMPWRPLPPWTRTGPSQAAWPPCNIHMRELVAVD